MKKIFKTKNILMLALVIAIICCGIGGTVAFIITSDGPVVNTFEPTSLPSEIVETFDKATKSNVKVQNTSTDVHGYIRVAVVVTWQDASGKVYPQMPVAGTDYNISFNTAAWTKDGYYYYHNDEVAPGGYTAVLIDSCTPVTANTPEGYGLVVEIISEAVQSRGMGATSAIDAFSIANNAN